MPVRGTLEQDMQDASNWFQCAATELKFQTVEMSSEEMMQLPTEDDE